MISHVIDHSTKFTTEPLCCNPFSLLFSFFQEEKTKSSNLLISVLRAICPTEYNAIVLSLLSFILLSSVNASNLNANLFKNAQTQTSFSLLSSCSVEAHAQESLTRFDVQSMRRQKFSQSFYSCFEAGCLPSCKVTTPFSLSQVPKGNGVDLEEKHA